MDLELRGRREDYTRAKEVMLERSHIPEARWWVVQAVDKKRARLNCIDQSAAGSFRMPRCRSREWCFRNASATPTLYRQAVPTGMLVPEIY